MMVKTPTIYTLVKGAAEGRTRLNAFDKALLEAGVGGTNLMRMSSILPPSARRVSIKDIQLPTGGLSPLAYAVIDGTTPGRYISGAVSVGIPDDTNEPGVMRELEGHAPLSTVPAIADQT